MVAITASQRSLNSVAGGDKSLRIGASGGGVQAVQKLLNKKGAHLTVDGDFGPKTQAAVKRFQQANGLKVTGVVDHNTLEKLEGARVQRPDEFIARGDAGKNVLAVEKNLQRLGYDVGAVDGRYDAATARAAMAFQHDQGLKKLHGSMTGGLQRQLRTELRSLNGAVEHIRRKPTDGRRRLDAATAEAARATSIPSASGTGGVAAPAQGIGRAGIGEGSNARVVKNVQAHLKAAGFDPGVVDGKFDGRTEVALQAFQKKSGLPVSGRVDTATWNKLKNATLEATSATQHGQRVGERSAAVLRTEKLLKEAGFKTGKVDGLFDAQTAAAVKQFEKKHKRHVDGAVSTGDLKALQKAAREADDVGGISGRAKKQMADLLAVAKRGAQGKRPMGWCLREVQDYLDQVTYGKGKVPRLPYARNYAEYLNRDGNAERLGLKRLNITNPYDAPPGAIVVVRAGTPGTSHPTAGDIVVKGHGDKFYNDGEMSYGGRGNFPKGNNYVLGVYVPA